MNWLTRISRWLVKSTGSRWLFDWGVGGSETDSGVIVGPESAQASSAFFSAVEVRAQDLAKLPLILYRRRSDGQGRDRAVNHPLFRLLTISPNENQTAFEFIEMMQAHLDLRGNAYARILRDGRRNVRSLVPLHPDWVTPRYDKAEGTAYYDLRMWGTEKTERLFSEDVLHLKGRSDDGLCGKSILSRARGVVGLDIAQQKHAAKSFANGARLSGIVSLKGQVGKEGRELARKEFNESFSGTNAAQYGGVAVFAEDGDFKPVSMTASDAQFIDQRKMSRVEVAAIMRVQPHKIGILDDAHHNNIEHQALESVTDTLMPIAERWEQRLNKSLLRESEQGEYYFEFLFDAILRGDFLTRMQGYAAARQWGLLSVNDICDRENWNHVDGGDERLVPLNMWPMGEPRPEKAVGTQPEPSPNSKEYSPIGSHLRVLG